METMNRASSQVPRPAVDLSRQHCRNHTDREAVARCPRCGHFYCRECVTEHENRMLCNDCLSRTTAASGPLRRPWRSRLGLTLCGGVGFLLLWGVFYLMGQGLLAIPSAVHEGTIWQHPWWQTP
jgi:hypothetical protein